MGDALKNPVCAAIVSYNDPVCLLKTIQGICNQVEKILVIDNGSSHDNVEKIRKNLPKNQSIEFFFLQKNMGIGYALNFGLKKSMQYGYQWLLTLDQDSTANENMVQKLYEYAKKNKKSAVVFPSLSNESPSPCSQIEHKTYAITSGNLINTEVLNALGGFNESYFIDGVDFDFCLRVVNAGFLITKINDAVLIHRLGEKKVINIFRVKFIYTEHSPLRRYYIFRNHFYLTRDYFFKNTLFVAKKNLFILIYFVQIILFDARRIENIRMIMRGIVDFCLGKRGVFS